MEEVLKADIFFFVTTVAIVLISLGMLVAIFYVVKILRNVGQISEKVKEESDEIVKDVRGLREGIKRQGLKLKDIASFFFSFLKPKKKAKKSKAHIKNKR